MLVDSHLHVWHATPSYPNPSATIVSPVSDVPIELLSEYMVEHEVERAVLVQPLYPGEDNSYIADCGAAQSDRFAAVCVVDPRAPDAADRLEYWTLERGCKGLRLRPRVPGESDIFGHPSTWPLWERARALNLVVSILGAPEHLPTVARLADRFPEVPITINHMAYPDVAGGVQSAGFQNLLALARYPRVYVQVSGFYYCSHEAYPYRDCWDLFRALYDRFGPSRLIWGSDFPHVLLKTGYRRNLHLLPRAFSFLTQGELARIMGDNATELYWSHSRTIAEPFEAHRAA